MNKVTAAAFPDSSMKEGMSHVRRMHDRSGTSLIEILVTVVIFLIGIVSVIRMFSGGFVSIKHGDNYTTANRLAQAELERLQGRAGSIPMGILSWGWNGNNYDVRPLTEPDDMDVQTRPLGQWPPPDMPKGLYYLTDVNKFRRIEGENTKIPVPVNLPSSQVASVYVVAFSPIMRGSALLPYANPIEVYGGAMRRRWLPRSYDADDIVARIRNAADYAIDYEQAKLFVKSFSGAPRTFRLKCAYWQNAGGSDLQLIPKTVSVVFDPSVLEDKGGYFENPMPEFAADPGFEGIDNGSDSLARQFVELGGAGNWSPDDPYQFAVIDSVAGTLAFNPLGYDYQEITARGKQALVANITYTVLDWHIIREERSIPDCVIDTAGAVANPCAAGRVTNPSALDVKLTLAYIMQQGESVNPDGTNYQGLAYDYNLPYDVMALDLDTGEWYTSDPACVLPTNPPRRALEVDYKNGIIHFDPDFWSRYLRDPQGTPPSPMYGRSFRIYYRVEGEWAVLPFKSYGVFTRSYGTGASFDQYYWDGDNMHFAPSNLGTSVAVDYAYRRATGPEEFVSGQVYEITRDNAAGSVDDGSRTYYIPLGDKVRFLYGQDAVITRISRVYGVTIGTKVVWREAGKGFRVGGWRKIELQTYMTRVAD